MCFLARTTLTRARADDRPGFRFAVLGLVIGLLWSGPGHAAPPRDLLASVGVVADRAGEEGRVEQIQNDLSWLGLHSGQIHGRMDAATSASVRAFQTSIGGPVTGTLDAGQRAVLAERARRAKQAAEYVTETVEWLGVQLAIPRRHFDPFELDSNEPSILRASGRGVGAPRLILGRDETSVPASTALQQLRAVARKNEARVLVDGTSGSWAFMVRIEVQARQPRRIYSIVVSNGSETKYLTLVIQEDSAVYMRPWIGAILESFEPFHTRAVPRSEYRSRLSSGDYPGGQSTPAWFENMTSNGSGSIVSYDGHILTNHHVIENCARLTVNGEEAYLIGSDSFTDLAVVRVPSMRGREPVQFREDPARLGEQIIVMGYPVFELSPALNATTGVISSEFGLRGDRTRHQITAPVQPGNSGGPALARDGSQVGVVVAKITTQVQEDKNIENISYIVRGREAQAFLARFDVPFLVTSASNGVAVGLSHNDTMRQLRRVAVRVECQRQ